MAVAQVGHRQYAPLLCTAGLYGPPRQGLPIGGGQRQIERGIEGPTMMIDLVEALVVEHGHERGVGRRTVGPRHAQRPLLLLSGRQAVAEGLPVHGEPLLGHRSHDGVSVGVAHAVLDPRKGQQQAVAVFFFICQLAVDECAVLPHAAALQQRFAAEHRIDDVQVRIAGTDLDGNGAAVGRKLRVGSVEPVVGLGGRALVVQTEHHELDVHAVVATLGLQPVLATFYVER